MAGLRTTTVTTQTLANLASRLRRCQHIVLIKQVWTWDIEYPAVRHCHLSNTSFFVGIIDCGFSHLKGCIVSPLSDNDLRLCITNRFCGCRVLFQKVFFTNKTHDIEPNDKSFVNLRSLNMPKVCRHRDVHYPTLHFKSRKWIVVDYE